MATLPTKRSPMSPAEGSASPKKSKADKKRESISRAQQWAAERKRKKEGVKDDSKKHKVNEEGSEDVVAKGEEMDVLENLPSPRSTRSRRSNRSDDVSKASEVSESSVGSRRSTRRRTMTSKASASVATASISRSKSKEATPRKSRKSLPPAIAEPLVKEEEEEEEETQKEEKEEPAIDNVQVVPEPEAKEEEAPTIHNFQTNIEQTEGSNQVANEIAGSTSIRSYIPSVAVFLYAIFLQWTVAFAAILVFFLDWFVFEFHPNGAGADYSNQRASCAILGLWLVTVAGYSIFLGAQSLAGWILATGSISMASFALKINWGASEQHDVVLPSLPIYSTAYFDINVLDALLFVAFAGWFIVFLTRPSQQHDDINYHVSSDVVIPNEQVETVLIDELEKPEVKRQETGPRSFIRDRVAVEKAGVTYHGTVVDYDPDTRMWLVKYDAGEGLEDDELNRLDIASAFRLYAKDLSDSLKAMWRANEI
ncbi:hypothetical protein HJC23_011303 [Cyclotella cryptica]|uniref:Uncharacterized protein n=1 Tax=Cyclotella cryptica TaxID=29204 RepID=A0ABD3R2I3_9STRA|eukprot:CCRYP_001705-RA/>CCRYP_001705-RA protein AED:0.18 eAED:0.18 QI:0/0.5/0.33/1/1/1/3/264/480